MIRNTIQYIAGSGGQTIARSFGTVRAVSNYASKVQIVAPFPATDSVFVNYYLYDARNQNFSQYLRLAVDADGQPLRGRDVVDANAPYYNDVADYNVWEMEISATALSAISKYRAGKVGISFTFRERIPAIEELGEEKGTFGTQTSTVLDLPESSSAVGDYYVCNALNFTSTETGRTFTFGEIAYWNGTKWLVATNHILRQLTPTVDFPVDPALFGTPIQAVDPTMTEQIIAQLAELDYDVSLITPNTFVSTDFTDYDPATVFLTGNTLVVNTAQGIRRIAREHLSVLAANVEGLQDLLDEKVDKVQGKELSTQDFTTALLNKLNGIPATAQENVIEVVKVDNVDLAISNKSVNIDLSGKADLVGGKIPADQLPASVDQILEYEDLDAFPETGESAKIYVALDTNKTYRWSGTQYVEISESLALGETESTAYRGDRGKIAYDHSQSTASNPHGTSLAQLSSVSITTPSSGQVLKYDGTSWINQSENVDLNNYTTGVSFNTSSGVLTMSRDGLSSLTVDLDGRYFESGDNKVPWGSLKEVPTTLSGFGITDGQPLDADLTAIAALSGTSGFLKKTAADTWSLDTNSYALVDHLHTNIYAPVENTGTEESPVWKIPNSYLPPLAITETFVVANQGEQNALTPQTGDVAIRTDLKKTFIYDGTQWQEMLTPTDAVLSVNSKTGAVVLNNTDVGAPSTTDFNTLSGTVSTLSSTVSNNFTTLSGSISGLDTRVGTLESVSHSHTNKTILDSITGINTNFAGTYASTDLPTSGAILALLNFPDVDWDGDALTLNGYASNTASSANTIVRRDANEFVDLKYDNSASTLVATRYQTAIDELDAKKADVGLLSSNILLYPTTSASDISGYYDLVSDIDDPRYNSTAADVPTGALSGTNILIASLDADPGLFIGNPGVINITTIGNIRKRVGNTTQYAEFFFRVFKRNNAGSEELLATSDTTGYINPSNGNYREFSASALLNNGNFLSSDRIVIKYYANAVGTASNYDFQFGGTSPVRTIVPVPVSVIPSDLASDILTDTTNFNGILSGTDNTVQKALDTLDNHNHDTQYQPLDGDLTSIAGLTGTSGFLKKTNTNTWTLDTTTYQVAGDYATNTYVNELLASADAMIFKGTLGTGGTIQVLPTTHGAGWTYKVITAGTYAGKVAEVGDLYLAIVDRSGSGNQDSDWTLVQTNIDGAVTGPVSSTSNNFTSFDGVSGKVVKDSGYNASSFAAASHTHGSITNDGKIGSTSGLAIVTGTDGVLETRTLNNSTSSSPLGTGTGLVTEQDVHYGLVKVNGSDQQSNTTIYAPTSVGSAGQFAKSSGSGAPAFSAIAISDVTDLQTSLDGKVDENSPITGATKTKITYDAKGLVTAGADLADTDIPTLSQSKITNLTVDLAAKAVVNYYTSTIPDASSWSGSSAPFTHTLSLAGITSTDRPIVDLDTSGLSYADVAARSAAWAKVYRVDSGTGELTFYATEKPTVTLPILVGVVK